MSNELASQSQCFGAYDNGRIIAFCAVLHQPHNINKNIKRCTRLVVLPDYQGIGIGTKLLNEIAKYYSNKGYDFSIVTSAKNLAYSLKNNNQWILCRYGRTQFASKNGKINVKGSTTRTYCKTFSFFYKSDY